MSSKKQATSNETLWQPVNSKPNRGDAHDLDILTPVSNIKNNNIKPLRPLTRKQQAFVQELITNPKQSAASAARKTYAATTDRSARSIATENLAKPSILLELSKHSGTAELTVIEVMNTSKEFSKQGNTAGANYATTALQAANSLLDRLHGKATQKIEQHSTTVTLSLSLKDITDTQIPLTDTNPQK